MCNVYIYSLLTTSNAAALLTISDDLPYSIVLVHMNEESQAQENSYPRAMLP